MKYQLLYKWRGDYYSYRPACKEIVEKQKEVIIGLKNPYFTNPIVIKWDVYGRGSIPEIVTAAIIEELKIS